MKLSLHLPLVACFLTVAACSHAVPAFNAHAPAQVRLPAVLQDQVYAEVSNKTNSTTATTATVSTVYKSSTTNLVLDAQGLLDLLANSLQTNFPAGTRLLLNGGRGYYYFGVSDASGTNLMMTVNSVLSLTTQGNVFSGVERLRRLYETNAVVLQSSFVTEARAIYAKIRYDDSSLSPTDGTHTVFELSGVGRSESVLDIVSYRLHDELVLPLDGGGSLHGRSCVFSGGILRATLNGTLPPP